MAEAYQLDSARPKRRRRRNTVGVDERTAIANRVSQFYSTEWTNRSAERDARLQRYAKYRLWSNANADWPWPGACFSLDTELLTEDGWRLVAEINIGDAVYTRAPDNTAEYRPVVKTTRQSTSEAVSFKGKSIDLLVTKNHRMFVENWAGKTQFIEAEQFVGLPNQGWSIPLTSTWRGENPAQINGIESRAYLRVLGWYIAEGSKNNHGSLGIAQGDANVEKCRIIERDLAAAHITWKRNGSTYWLHSTDMTALAIEEFRSFGVCDEEKVLPDYVLDLCPALLHELLDALVLGDGHRTKRNGHTTYTTTSRALADQIQIIAQKLGQRATIVLRNPRMGGKIGARQIVGARQQYDVSINQKKTIQVRKLRVETVHFPAPVEFACVNVPPHHTLYARRNGKAVWCGNSDQAIPDMLQDSQRVQDTLVNAVMSQRPPVISRAAQQSDQEKQDKIDRLIEHQVFNENAGEVLVGEMAESFVNDPACTVFTPWVRERRTVADVAVYDPIPEEQSPRDYFFALVRQKFPAAQRFDEKAGGWEWQVTLPKGKGQTEERLVCFYTTETDEVEMVIESEAITFDGPRPFVKDYDDVIFPARSANLQMPGPSNPNGAPWVILRDFPTIHEIRKLKESGYYDLLTTAELEGMENAAGSTAAIAGGKAEAEVQKDRLQGVNEAVTKSKDKGHNRLTRLMCFDVYDGQDMIFWVIEETKILLKSRMLIDLYPSNPPRRPLDGGSYLPVQGRYSGMSLLEVMEAMHDAVKVLVDQSLNANDLAIASPGYYRPSGGMNPEVLRIEPFTLSPLQNPQQDVVFPQMGNPQAMGFALNMLSIMGSWQDKLTMVTESSFGQVQPGSSSALRTIGNMAMLQGQNEARPERILRRFFTILTGVWRQIHSLNQSFLPKNKQFRIAGVTMPGQDPYLKIDSAETIAGNFQFDFDANVLNTSKGSLQQSLESLMKTYVNPLMIQLGIVKPDNIYRLARDYGRAYGQNVDPYISPPTPQAAQPSITAEEAILAVMQGHLPHGAPAEPGGPEEHLQKLIEFAQSDNFGLLKGEEVAIFRTYLQQVQQAMQQMQQAQMLQQNAAQFAQSRNQGTPGAPSQGAAQPPTQPPQVSGPNELMNETLPTAGGGANSGV